MSDIHSRVHLDRNDGRMIFERVQDVQPILDENKSAQTHGTQRTQWGRKIASIPNVIIEKWINEEGRNFLAMSQDEFSALIRRKLRDPDYRWLRTVNGSL